MIAQLVRLHAALLRAAQIATRRRGAALWTLAALTSALFAAGIAAVAAATVDGWIGAHPDGRGAMVVYLGEGVDDAHAGALVSELRRLPGVERAELVPAAESARRLIRALGADGQSAAGSAAQAAPGLLDGVEPASLPASVEVTLAPGVADVAALSPTLRALRGTPGVADVVVEGAEVADHSAGAGALAGAMTTARTVAWAGAVLFAGLALVIVLAAVRIGLARPKREVAVLALLGAPTGFTAIPSALAGALHGLVAAAIAAAGLIVVVNSVGDSLGPVALVAPSVAALAALVGLGALIGLAGGGLAGVARGD